MESTLTIDVEKIRQQIVFHESEATRWRDFLARASKFASDTPPAKKSGRPRKRGEPYNTLAAFVSKKSAMFTSTEMKEALNGKKFPKYKFRAAIKQLVDEKKLIEEKTPAGMRPGEYRNPEAITVDSIGH